MNCIANLPDWTMYFIQQSNFTNVPLKSSNKRTTVEQITEPLIDITDAPETSDVAIEEL